MIFVDQDFFNFFNKGKTSRDNPASRYDNPTTSLVNCYD